MTKFVRSNVWNNGGTFDNTDLLWYATAVGVMQERHLDDSSSWWFFAAIHAQYATLDTFPGWGSLPGVPKVPVTPLPAQKVADRFWDQCQHQSWYFMPWHRGYLLALEAHMRAIVVSKGGPPTWALPYWNYLGPDTQSQIPPAFLQKKLPDGRPNPLYVTARYGPESDGTVFIPTLPIFQQHPNDPNLIFGPVTDACLSDRIFTGSDDNHPEFGGLETGFWPGGDPFPSGDLEGNPHNLVHVYVGGNAPDGKTYGLMSDPGIAALDPIFYVHHANIDRMWAMWNKMPHDNPNAPNWLAGPTANGERQFVMPMPDGTTWVYTPKDVATLDTLNYSYDELPQLPPPVSRRMIRLTRLGVAPISEKDEAMAVPDGKQELVGASEQTMPLAGTGATATVRLAPDVQRKITASITRAAITKAPDRVFLKLENVRGTHDAAVLSVYVNLPQGERPADHPELLAGSVGLFGLRRASLVDSRHGGHGLTFVLEITSIVDALHLRNALDDNALQVTIVPHQRLPDPAQITVGRIGIYREGV